MSKITRREFLARSGAAVAGGLLVNPLLTSPDKLGVDRRSTGSRVLVACHLMGGNDGLNTVVPYRDGLYHSLRGELAIPREKLIPLNRELALHPALSGLKKLWDEQKLAIVNGVGYQNADRSHYRGTMVWHTADPDVHSEIGWIGRYLDTAHADSNVAVGFGNRPLTALAGETVSGHTFPSFDHAVTAMGLPVSRGENDIRYADDPFGHAFSQASRLIASSPNTRVIHIGAEGFDTHMLQLDQQAKALRQFGDALAAFMDDMQRRGRSGDVVVLAYSEFGRRVEPNGTGGTDHGTAGPVFLAGAVRGGVYGKYPSLSDLVDGALKPTTDFRSVYATVLKDFLRQDVATLASHPTLAFI